MSNLLITADDVRVVRRADEHQHTAPAVEVIAAGQYIRWSSAGKFELGNGSSAGEVGDGYLAEKDAAVGEAVTGLKGPTLLDVGDALSGMAYGDSVFLSDTDGTLATTAGTVSTVVGKVVPGWAGSAKKLLRLTLN